MTSILLWYILTSLVGWSTFPLAYRLLPALADKGYAFIRTLGLLVWGFFFWLLAALGILRNDVGGLLFALGILLVLSGWALRGVSLAEIGEWLRSQRKLVLGVELLFLVAFIGWAVVRAANPEAIGTEKPMELAFINAILRSPTFPPHDPWLSGYAISYYYFGYVLVAMLAKLTGVSGGVAFNLGISLVFALSSVGAYGMVYNLLVKRNQRSSLRAVLSAYLGPIFILLVGNLEGFLEVLHAKGLFWSLDEAGGLVSPFWKWLDMQELSLPPAQPFSWIPTRYLWWWRASRVVQDYDFLGNFKEVIDEFPAFSYLLADLHPHVLAMPFAFLAMALSHNLFLGGGRGRFDWLQRRINVRTLGWASVLMIAGGLVLLWSGVSSLSLRSVLLGIVGMVVGGIIFVGIRPTAVSHGLSLLTRADLGERVVGMPIHLSPTTIVLSTLVLGGLAFLNTWDFPFYVALTSGAYVLGRIIPVSGPRQKMTVGEIFKDFVGFGFILGIGGVILYLPFYLGFASQAGGVLPNLIYPTRGTHLWVMFATLLLPLIAFMLYLWKLGHDSAHIIKGLTLALGVVFILWVLSILLGLGIAAIPGLGDFYVGSLAAPDWSALFRESLNRRLASPGGWITLTLLLGLTSGLLLRIMDKGFGLGDKDRHRTEDTNNASLSPSSPQSQLSVISNSMRSSHAFALLLVLLGVLLVLGPEFFYLRDQFGWRINTIFKFYYQAWLLLGIAASYGTAVLLWELDRLWGVVFRVVLVLILGMGLTYTILGLWHKTNGFRPAQGWTLDGTAYLERQSPDEMAAIRWLQSAPDGVVAEAVSPTGGSYSNYARVSMLSGLPAVLGWTGHESQWRGGAQEMGSRQGDLERLYCSRSWDEAQSIVQQYRIRYVYVGTLERITYTPNQSTCVAGLNEAKFARHLEPVFQQGDVTIYQAP